ncbi:hypothetical protein [Neotabrizicola sp. sgz301269]|uniref:hypothetical protein n=1 Tax=Neotabrizicola sp. sgz301269 TaxID=3276282 RepID=UPI0037701198
MLTGSIFVIFLMVSVGAILAFWLYIWLPATMAARRQRSALGWVIVTLFLSPLITLPLLVLLGPAPRAGLSGTQLQRGWR